MKGVLGKLGAFVSGMAARPLSTAFVLTILLWFWLDNFLVAAMVGLLLAFFVSALVSVWKLNRRPGKRRQ